MREGETQQRGNFAISPDAAPTAANDQVQLQLPLENTHSGSNPLFEPMLNHAARGEEPHGVNNIRTQASLEPAESEPRKQTAIEKYDSSSVKKLTLSLYFMTALFLVLYIVSAVDDDKGVKESLWLFFAWSLSVWSVGLLVVWERESPFELCPEGGLRQASPATALWMFRAVYWTFLLCWACMLFSYTFLIIHCWSEFGASANAKQCVLDEPVAWRVVLWSRSATGCCLACMLVTQFQTFLYSAERRSVECWYYPALIVLTTATFTFSIWGYSECDFDQSGVWDRIDSLVNGNLTLSKLERPDQVYHACTSPPWLTSQAIELFWLVGIVIRWIRLFSFGNGCGRAPCCCTGYNPDMPRWALIQSHFLVRSFIPTMAVTGITLAVTVILYSESGNLYLQSVLLGPILMLYTFNFYLFACLPDLDTNTTFCCLSLSAAPGESMVDFNLVLRAFEFSWDAYFDDPRLPVLDASAAVVTATESSFGMKEYYRNNLVQRQNLEDPANLGSSVVYISNDTTDTHTQMCVVESDGTNPRMLVISFRGTNSTKNLGTDCSFTRQRVHCHQPRGLVFDEEASDDVMGALMESTGLASSMIHGGFSKAYLSVRDEILEQHEKLVQLHQPTAVLVTGHRCACAFSRSVHQPFRLLTRSVTAWVVHLRRS
jgi:hypothetical protein